MATTEMLSREVLRSRTAGRVPVLAAACLGVFAGFGSLFIYTFGVFLKPLSLEFGWSRAQVSSGFLTAVLAVAICSPFLGRLFDRSPARKIVIPCTLIYALGFASLGLLTSRLWHFIVILGLLGIAGNGTTQLGYARVVSTWFDQSRGRALAVVMAGSGVGSAVWPVVAQYLIGTYGWRWAFALLGAVVLIVSLPMTIAFLYERSGTNATVASANIRTSPASIAIAEPNPGLLEDLLSPPFIGIVSALLLFSLATNGLNTHWFSLLTDRGFGPGSAAGVISVAGFATLGSKLLTGFLLDRFYANYTAAWLFSICAAGIAAVTYGQSHWTAFAAAILVGVGMGAESDVVPYLLTRYFGLRRFSELYGYTWSVYAVAGGVGPIFAGLVFDSTASYKIATTLFSGMVVVAALIFVALPRYRR